MAERTAGEYDAIAADYHWIYSDRVLSGERFIETHRDVLDALPPHAAILDCACGIGIHALALAREGHAVRGSDGSAGMVAEARDRAGRAGFDIPFDVCRWEDLPQAIAQRFDLVFCCGNAIGHCRDRDEMVRSLRGMHSVLKVGSRLVLDSRHWEKIHAEKPSVSALGTRLRDGMRAVPVYFWTVPDEWGRPVVIEVAVVVERDGTVSCHSHRVTYYPFRFDGLRACLLDAGFVDVQPDLPPSGDVYRVVARRPQP